MQSTISRVRQRANFALWISRASWVVLALAVRNPLETFLETPSNTVSATAATLCVIGWVLGVGSVVIARPVSITAQRILAPGAFLVVVALAARDISGESVAALLVATSLCVICLNSLSTLALANGNSYGLETRFPLKIPIPFLPFVGILLVCIGASAVAGPLLVASGFVAAGVLSCAVGFPLAFLGVLAVHTLSGRWAVFVPAGLTIVDSISLAEPALFTKAEFESVAITQQRLIPDGYADLRVGNMFRSIAASLREPHGIIRRQSRNHAEGASVHGFLIAPVLPLDFHRAAQAELTPISLRLSGEAAADN